MSGSKISSAICASVLLGLLICLASLSLSENCCHRWAPSFVQTNCLLDRLGRKNFQPIANAPAYPNPNVNPLAIEEKELESNITSSSSKDQDQQKKKFKTICVFCGSRAGLKPSFSDAAIQLGQELVDRKIDLVFGGGNLGLMGLLSKTVLQGGGHVLGISPKFLMPGEISGKSNGELEIVSDMHTRKSEMEKHADAFIALPGGYGTFEELLEMITWAQLGIHHKPVGLLNVDGYYEGLLALFDKAVEEDFMKDSDRHCFVLADTAKELIQKMEGYVAVHA